MAGISLVIPTAKRKTGKKSKRRDDKPSRKKYWASRILETRKVRNLVRHCGMTQQSAFNRWHKERKTRVPNGFLRNIA